MFVVVSLQDARMITAVELLLFVFVVFPIAHALYQQNGQPPIMKFLANSLFGLCVSACARILALFHPYEMWARFIYIPTLAWVIFSFVRVAMTNDDVNSIKTYFAWALRQFAEAGSCLVTKVKAKFV